MKGFRFKILLLLTFMSATVFGQDQKEIKSGTFACKAKYAAGKNSYLLDECNVNYTYKVVVGDPVCNATASWKRKDDYTVGSGAKKAKITYSQLSEYPDLQKRFELITPTSAKFKFTVLFYSAKSQAYIASAKSEIEIDNLEKAGTDAKLSIPKSYTWQDLFTNVVVGKQTEDKVGTIISDAALSEFYKTNNILTGKLNDPNVRGFRRTLRNLLVLSDRLDIKNATMDIEWDEAEYNYIIDEYNKRKSAEKFLAAKDTLKAEDTYYGNRKYAPVVREKSPNFWSTTVMPIELIYKNLDEAEKFYAKGNYPEAKIYYKKVVDADPSFAYANRRLNKIKKYEESRATRNVGPIEFVFVEGSGSIKSFYICKTEITQRQWARVMGRNANISTFKGCGDCPVENVSWNDAMEFIKKLNEQTGMKYRLPRINEWEYAAKGGVNNSTAQYSGSDNLDEIAWCAYNSDESTHSSASKSPNSLGIYDMTGNVSEWVSDAYDKNTKWTKGGSWADDAQNSTISSKEKYDAKTRNNRIGFRICQDE